MMWDGGFGMSGGWVFGWVIMLIVLVLIVVGIVLLVRGLSGRQDHDQMARPQGPPPAEPGPKRALQILEERYARGEIDQEEFMRRKADLLA
jgi:putative membrane protein